MSGPNGGKVLLVAGLVGIVAVACSFGQEVAIKALADASVSDYSRTSMFGDRESLSVRRHDSQNQHDKAYLCFSLKDLPAGEVAEAKLKLRVTGAVQWQNYPVTINVHGIIDNKDWDPAVIPEATLNGNNAPRNGMANDFTDAGQTAENTVRVIGAAKFKSDELPKVVEVDVTDYIMWARGENEEYSKFAESDRDGIVTFLLNQPWPNGAGATVNSKEATGEDAFPPTLVVTVVQ